MIAGDCCAVEEAPQLRGPTERLKHVLAEGTRVPRLADVLDWAATRGAAVNVELKHDGSDKAPFPPPLKARSPLFDMWKEGIDLSKVQWAHH